MLKTTWGRLTPEQKKWALERERRLFPDWGRDLRDSDEIHIIEDAWRRDGWTGPFPERS